MIDPLILGRSVHFAATAFASGTVCFVTLVADVPSLRCRLNWVVWSALAVATLSGIGWLLWLAAEIFGAPIVEVCLHGGAWQVASDTRFGMVWCARLMLALLLGLLMLWPRARWLALIIAALLIALLALIGHAGAMQSLAGRVHLASDMVHLMAAGAWLGGLPALVLLLAKAPGQVAISATRRFSLLGIVSIGVLLTSGAVNSWNLLAGPRDLWATDYGRLLLFKIGLFGAMVSIATVNRYHLIPRLPAASAIRALRRNSLCEIGLGLGVLAFVGALGTLAPTVHVHTPPPAVPPDAAFVHIHTMADITIDPGRAGTVKVAIRVSREDFSDIAAKEVRLSLNPPGGSQKALERAALRMPDGTWTIDRLEIGQAGIWTLRVIVISGTRKPIVLDASVVIDR